MSTRNTQHYDAVIAGARCAGAATALLLARQGARVLLLDKSRYGTDTLSTHALMRGAVLQLHNWGLLPRVIAAGTPPVQSAIFYLPGAVSTVEIKPKNGVEALYAPRRTVPDAILADAARDAGADVRFGASVTGLRRVRDGTTEGYHWYFRDGAAAGVIPTNDGLACVFAATSAAGLRREPGGAGAAWRRILGRAAPELAERLDQRVAAGPPRVFPGLTGYLREAAGPGWALVGDAGYFKDPITAHGITDSLRDAEILARAVTTGGPGAFGRYQAERDELSLRLFRVTGRIASFDWTADQIGGHLLELSEAMAEEVAAMAGDHLGNPSPQPDLAPA